MQTVWWWIVFALTWTACWWVATRVVMQVWQGFCVIGATSHREDAQELLTSYEWREDIIQRMRKHLRDHTQMPGWLCWAWDLEAEGSIPGWLGWAIMVATWPLWWTLLMCDSRAAATQAVKLWELSGD